MASSKIMKSSNTRNSDLSKRFSSSSTKPQQQQQEVLTDSANIASAMTVDGILRNVYNTKTASTADATLLGAQFTLIETNTNVNDQNGASSVGTMKSVDDVWREIVSGEKKEMKEEVVDEMMTLEDFLAKAGAVEDAAAADDDMDVKGVTTVKERLSGGVYVFDQPPPDSPFQVEGAIVGFGNGVVGERRKRGRVMLEALDKAAQQRQRRMIKNRESAARSRERKQAYQVELESLAVRLEEENEQLLKEKAERTKERYKQRNPYILAAFKSLMEKVIPVVEKKRPPRVLRRVCSIEW